MDAFCARVTDARPRKRDGHTTTVGALAALEGLAPLPAAFPATLTVERVVTAQALVAFARNQYSVPPGLGGTTVTVTHRLDQPVLDITTAGGTVLARHHRTVDGAGVVVRDSGHVRALEIAVLTAFTTDRACGRKVRRPPSPAALAEAGRLRPDPAGGREVVVDLAVWADAARDRRVAP